jgi:signal transduction histidine kinase
MKSIISYIISFCLFTPLSAQAQKSAIDSLETRLQTTKQDTNRLQILSQLAWQYMTSVPEKTKKLALEGITLARRLNYPKYEILLLNYLGDCTRRQGQYAQGVDYTTQSLKKAEQIKDSLAMADAHRMLGMIHSFSLNQYDLALTYYQKTLPIYEHSKDKKRMAALYSNMAWIFYMMNKKIPQARQYTEKAIKIAQDMGDTQLLSWCLNSKAMVFSRENRLDSALHYFQQSNALAQKVNDRAVIAYNNNLIGHLYNRQSRYENAIKIFYLNIPQINQVRTKFLTSDAYEGLATAYTYRKQYDSAYFYYKSHIRLKDSLLNWETSQKVAVIAAEYAKEKKEAKIQSLEKERATYLMAFSVIFIALLSIIWLIVRNNQHRLITNRQLQEKNEEIAQQNEELYQSREEITTQRDMVAEKNQALQELNRNKDKLFAIIGHDLRSPINSFKGLLSLLDDRYISTEDFISFAGKLRIGVEQAHFTLNNLLEWANSQMQGSKTNPQKINLYQLGEENLNLFTQLATAKELQLINQIDSNMMVWADIDDIQLVFRNLINNAIKFTEKGGNITLRSKSEAGICEVAVTDSGIGMCEPDTLKLFHKNTHFTTYGTSGEKGTGLGLLLCQEMVEKNEGKIWVESELGKGATFKFTLNQVG